MENNLDQNSWTKPIDPILKPIQELEENNTMSSREGIAIIVLSIVYLVGILGIALNIHDDFILLTPLNLIFSVNVVLWFHPKWDSSTTIVLLLSFFVGFTAELLGVQTGKLFGEYAYGNVLGWKLLGTPPMIGINWLMLVYICGVAVNHFVPDWGWFVKAVLAAGLMVGLDFFIEPVAIQYNFWQWSNNVIPIQNYIAWFLIALPLTSNFMILQGHIKNNVAIALLILQFIFFLVLRIL